jgi:hypothetical protein
MFRRVLFLALCALTLVGFPSSATAESVVILELRTKDMPPALTEQVQRRLAEALKGERYRVIDEETVAQQMKEMSLAPGCSLGPCLARIGRSLKVDRAILAGLASQGSSYDIILTMLETGGGTMLAQITHRCEVCTFKEVESAIVRAAEDLHKTTLVFLSTRGSLVITSKPDGANVLLDSLPAGQTPVTLVVSPGEHLVEIVGQGGRATKQEVWLVAGKQKELYADLGVRVLVWGQGKKTMPPPSRIRPWMKWTALGVGVLLTGIGAGLWAMDGGTAADPRYVHDTRAGGITMVGLGSAAMVGGAALYLFERSSRERQPTAAPLPSVNASLTFSF